MKYQFMLTAVVVTAAMVGPSVSRSLAQDFAEGPIGEITSVSPGGNSGILDFAGAVPGQSPKVAFSSNGQAIEVFDPMVATIGPVGQPSVASVGQPDVGAGNDWITRDGRINLDGLSQSPERALWAPDNNVSGEWSDGPFGLQVGVDLLFFSRGADGGTILFNLETRQDFVTEDIDIDVESTARYRIGFGTEYGTGFEFVGYDFDEFNGGFTLSEENVVPVFFGGIPLEPVDSYSITFKSRIKSYELNAWSRRSQRVRVGYGLRAFAIEENFDVTEGTDSSTAGAAGAGGAGGTGGFTGFFSATDNNLFGGQLMLELFRPVSNSVYLEGGVKGMLLNNRVDLDIDTGNRDDSGSDNFVTGGVNFHGGLTYRALRGFWLRAGYEGVFIGSVASGASQSALNDDFFTSVSPVGSGLYYGGGYVGCTLTF